MTLTCQNCGKPFETDRSWPGDLVPCPSCGANVDLVHAETNIPELSPSLMGEDRPLRVEAGQTLPAGAKVGQYVIEKLIGRGGMGAVYKGKHPMLDREVAVKVLPPEFAADADFVTRFKREAMALAKLQHPNIVGVHDMGVQGELYYFVMEYVEGVDLRRLLRDRTLKPEQALAIVPKLCTALEYAHARGIVHRDIKPENIIIDTNGEPKIADFGLAKIVRGERGRTLITHTDVVMGTPDYMAPEQREVTKTADHRADIYSMGVVFYEMLTGELPVGRFDPPSKKVTIDVRLDEVVLRALENSPERRYQHARDMGDDVTRITSAPAPVPAQEEPRRRPVLGACLSAGGMLLFSFAAWCELRLYGGPIRFIEPNAWQSWVTYPGGLEVYNWVVPVLGLLTAAILAFGWFSRQRAFRVAPALFASIHCAMNAYVFMQSNQADARLGFIVIAVLSVWMLAKAWRNPDRAPQTVLSLRHVLYAGAALAVMLLAMVGWVTLRASPPPGHEPPPKFAAMASESSPPSFIPSRRAGHVRDLIFEPSAVPIEQRLSEAEALCAGSRDPDAALLLGVIARERGQWRWWHGAGAPEKEYASALLYFDRILQANPNDAVALTERGLTYAARARFRMGRGLDTAEDLTKATDDLTRSIALRESVDAWRGLGDVFGLRGDPVNALEKYERAAARDINDVDTYIGRAQARLATGDMGGAFADADFAVRLRASSPLPYIIRAALKLQAGRPAEAAGDYATAIGFDPALRAGPVGYQYALALADKANALDDAGRTEEAVTVWTEALAVSPDHGMFLLNRARLLLKLGKRPEALDDLNDATKTYELEARRERASLYDSMGRLSDAIADLEWCVAFADNPAVESDRRKLDELRTRQ